MPRGDRTGPMGYGPMTGRGLGYCAGYASPGYTRSWPRYGMGWGRGFGRGWRHGPYAWGAPAWPAWGWAPPAAASTQEQELAYLQSEAEMLKQQQPDRPAPEVQEGQIVKQIQVTLLKEKLAINMTASFPEDRFQDYYGPFQQFLKSLKIT